MINSNDDQVFCDENGNSTFVVFVLVRSPTVATYRCALFEGKKKKKHDGTCDFREE